jgi:aminopeptidase YwaD
MTRSRVITLVVSLLALSCSPQPLPYISTDITAVELQQHVKYLASDELEGRGSGTRANQLAGEYIAKQFKRYGLRPLGDDGSWFQTFTVLTGLEAGRANRVTVTLPHRSVSLALDEDFRPLSITHDTVVSGSVVFAGYGISADSLNYDDYAGVDVRDKIVIVLRYAPDYGQPDSKLSDHAPILRKAFNARTKGAAAMLLVTGPADEETPSLMPLRPERGVASAGLAAAQLTHSAVDSMLRWSGSDTDLRSIQQMIYDSKGPRSFEIPNLTISIQTRVERLYSPTSNVIGLLEGNDPQLKNEVIVIGAHFDHVGWGGPGSGSMQSDIVAIHNGADDNASGTAAVLELAQAFSAHRNEIQRSHLFITFSGEEMGLLGSAHYVKNPPLPLDKTIAMINLDMVGRLRDSSLTVEGIGTSSIWKEIVERENTAFNFKLRLGQRGSGPSDHASFYGKDIPVLFFFTGLHEDYHRPSDDWEKINYEGEQRIAQFAFNIVRALDSSPKPEFARVQVSASDTATRRGFRVAFGIVPDYSEGDNGLKISGTRPGSAAEKAGLQNGDVITKLGGKDVRNIYDLTFLLEHYKPGDEVEVVFTRDGVSISAVAKLQSRR